MTQTNDSSLTCPRALLTSLLLAAAHPRWRSNFLRAGASPRIDAIKKAGVLRVGVLANAPWLVENTGGGGGEAWSGPAWLLAKEYARLLGVKLEAVPVSHETKVPVLASNQVDITHHAARRNAGAPQGRRLRHLLDHQRVPVRAAPTTRSSPTPSRSTTSTGPTSRSPTSPAAREENWVKERFPKAQLRGVVELGLRCAGRGDHGQARRRGADQPRALGRDGKQGQGARGAAEGEQLPGQHGEGRARSAWRSTRTRRPSCEWLRAVDKQMEPKLRRDEQRIVGTMN